MRAPTPKQHALRAIEALPDDVSLDEIVYRLYLFDTVRRGLEDVDAGGTISSDISPATSKAGERDAHIEAEVFRCSVVSDALIFVSRASWVAGCQ